MFLKFAGYALAAALVGYCIYFDKKRRIDPNYKQKVRERRLYQKSSSNVKTAVSFPNPNDREAVERFYVHELQLGQTLMSRGEVEKGVEHLAKAVLVCGQTEHLLQILQQSFPTDIFALLLTKIRFLTERMKVSTTEGFDQCS